MDKHSDLTFITNEKEETLLNRFKVLIKDTELFDVLVGYFYTSGFHSLYPSLEKTKKIRILIGISTNRQALDWMKLAHQQELQFSSAETKENLAKMIVDEMDVAEDSNEVEQGVTKFIAWLNSGKLEIKAYPTENIHAKLYIMSFNPDDRDAGRVITGSSNFTQSGLVNNLEFNVELKARGDYEFAKEKFETLWRDAIDVKDKYIQTIQEKTWLNDSITPYQLYLKFLYEYFKDELAPADEIADLRYRPLGFMKLEYQEQAVLNAKKILEAYSGVFISDVVGLGKTYVSAMLAKELDGGHLVLAPPALLDKANPGSWPNVFHEFGVFPNFQSLGNLDPLIRRGTKAYKNVFIDEAHRFRTESNQTYEKLAQICRGKRVVLVTATPLNNTPQDILSQIKLFQNSRKSTIPNLLNLDGFFARLKKNMKDIDRQRDRTEYMRVTKDNANAIRESVLKYLMVRRTRKEIESYFSNDLKSQDLKFPEVENPQPIYYQLNEQESEVFTKTIELIAQQLKYTRYKTMLYYQGKDAIDPLERQSQENMARFMKILLIKRLESSFYAFRKTVGRFISHHEMFLQELQQGNVYISKGYANKIFDLIEKDDDQAIQKILDDDKATKYPAEDFTDRLQSELEKDLEAFKEIQSLWSGITRDPKLLAFVDILSSHSVLHDKKSKLITFTESRETAEYLAAKLEKVFPREVLMFSGISKAATREKVIENFDARSRQPKDDYRILITTEVLSEGVNLHRSNVVINYDIPWNPTRLMQRVGRINRVDTKFDKIYSFNFFPTEQSNDQIKLKEAAEAKIQSFIALLGADARLLTEGEDIESHELFDRLASKKTITGEDEGGESELKYLQIIKNIRDKSPDLFAEIKSLPMRARTARQHAEKENQLLTYFRKGKLQKFFLIGKKDSEEINFMHAATRLEIDAKTPKEKPPADFYDKLEQNKHAFADITSEAEEPHVPRGGASRSEQLLKYLRAIKDLRQYTDTQEAYLKKVINQLEDGALPKQTATTVWKALKPVRDTGQQPDPLHVLACLQKNIPNELLQGHFSENVKDTSKQREVILSEYLIAG